MKQSLSYYLVLSILKLKGIKRSFSKSPIDFKKIRKKDIYQPSGNFFRKHTLQKFNILNSEVTEIGFNKNSKNLLIFIHGGAFVSGPAKHHWDTIKKIAKETKFKIWMCNYPKAPEYQIKNISENIDAIYTNALENYPAKNISILGDSVGGTLSTALVQRLLLKQIRIPNTLILISPVMDASMSNPEIEHLEQLDPILSKTGVISAKNMCASNIGLKNQMISPLYGNFEDFPYTILFLAGNDIMYPDGKIAEKKMKKANVKIEVIEGFNMPHIWPLLPIKEAKVSLNKIITILKISHFKLP